MEMLVRLVRLLLGPPERVAEVRYCPALSASVTQCAFADASAQLEQGIVLATPGEATERPVDPSSLVSTYRNVGAFAFGNGPMLADDRVEEPRRESEFDWRGVGQW